LHAATFRKNVLKSGVVSAFRQPDAGWTLPSAPLHHIHALAHKLRREQREALKVRQERVRSSRCQQFNATATFKVGEAVKDIAAATIECGAPFGEKPAVMLGNLRTHRISRPVYAFVFGKLLQVVQERTEACEQIAVLHHRYEGG
jgi:hypothetical protein